MCRLRCAESRTEHRARGFPRSSSMTFALPLVRSLRSFLLALVVLLAAPGVPPGVAATGSVVYTYDTLGRIATASYDTGVIIIYTYDANGNRTAQVVNVNSAGL